MSNVLAALFRGLGAGAGNLYTHRMQQQAIAREEAAAALARADRLKFQDRSLANQDREFDANKEYRDRMLGLQRDVNETTRLGNEQDFTLGQERNHQMALENLRQEGVARQFLPSNPEGELAARRFGGTIAPIAEVLDAARQQANSRRGPVDIPGFGTALYDGEHMDGMSNYMGNFNRPSSGDSYSQRRVRLASVVDRAGKAVLDKYGLSRTLDLDPQQRAEYDAERKKAMESEAAAFEIGIGPNGVLVDLRTNQPDPTPLPDGNTGTPQQAGGMTGSATDIINQTWSSSPGAPRLTPQGLTPSPTSAAPPPSVGSAPRTRDVSKFFKP